MKYFIALSVLAATAHAGIFSVATYPVRHPVKVMKTLVYPVRHPIKTVK